MATIGSLAGEGLLHDAIDTSEDADLVALTSDWSTVGEDISGALSSYVEAV